MSKTKLLVVGDAGRPTGFEKVLRNVVAQLHATDKYDITIRGIGYDPDRATRAYPVPVKTAGGTFDDPVGIQSFGDWIDEDKPDAVWVLQDLWNIAGYMLFKPVEVPTVAYFPVDTPNMQWGNAMALAAVSEAVSYTKFGAHETAVGVRDLVTRLERGFPADEPYEWFTTKKFGVDFNGRVDRLSRWSEPDNYNRIPHGLEHGVFVPRNKDHCRREFGIPNDAFVVMNVGTNQFRKRLDLTMRAFAMLLDGHPNALLVLHCAGNYGSMDGYNLAQMAELFGIAHRTKLIHLTHGDLTDDRLCTLYNCADVHLNTSGGEGWGLTSVESAACGVPQVVPDWSATREIWTDQADLIAVRDYRIEPKQVLNTAHAVIDVADAANKLCLLADNPDLWAYRHDQALACAAKQASWEKVGNAFDQVIQNALNEPAARPLKFKDITEGWADTIHTEVHRWLHQL